MIEGTTGLMEETMFDASRRPIGRLSYWVMAAVMMCGLVRTASGAGAVPPSGPATTTVADAVAVNVPSQNALFSAIVRRISIDVVDPMNDRGMYTIEFANDLAAPLALWDDSSATTIRLQDLPLRLSTTQVGTYYLGEVEGWRDGLGAA